MKYVLRLFGGLSILFFFASAAIALIAILDGWYYHQIHSKTLTCVKWIEQYHAKFHTYPTSATIERWRAKLELFPALSLSAPSFRSVPDKSNTKIPVGSFALAYWDGDFYEFYYPWQNQFTTSILDNSGSKLLVSLILSALGFYFLSHRNRHWSQKNKKRITLPLQTQT